MLSENSLHTNWKAITLDRNGDYYAMVDEERYDELMQWRWHLYSYRSKLYAKRTKRKDDDWRLPKSIYMHRWLAEKYLTKPEPAHLHIIVDHKYSNGLDNRLRKLVWATPQQNRLNVYGMWWQQGDFIRDLERNAKDAERSKAHLGHRY